MADKSFIERLLEVHVTLRAGEFREGSNTKIITGVPIKVSIEKTGPPGLHKARVSVRGLRLEDIEKMTTLAFRPLFTARNGIAVYAGNAREGMHLAFSGEITRAAADFNQSPDVAFEMECMTGYFGKITPAGPLAVSGARPAADIVAEQAKAMGYAFRNDGVTAGVSNCVFNGSPLDKARAVARQIGAELLLDDGVVILSPKGGNNQSGNAVLLNKATGLLGYPVITNEGVDVNSLYNPAFCLGGII